MWFDFCAIVVFVIGKICNRYRRNKNVTMTSPGLSRSNTRSETGGTTVPAAFKKIGDTYS